MADPEKNPRQFIIEANLTPTDQTFPATRESIRCLDDEIQRLESLLVRLMKARNCINERMKKERQSA